MARVLPSFHAPQNVGLLARFPYFNMFFNSASAVCNIADGASSINEISGMHALSGHTGNIGTFAVIDDDITDRIFFIDRDGASQSYVQLTNLTWQDGECVTGYTDASTGTRYLVIGEIGDNNAVRTYKKLHRFVEPEVTGSVVTIGTTDYDTITAQFPATPTFTSTPGAGGILGDTEALVIDPIGEKIFIFTKREPQTRIYSLPLQSTYPGIQTFTYEGDVNSTVVVNTSGPSTVAGGTYQGVTETALSNGSHHLLMKTYDKVYQFWREDPTADWADILQDQTPIVDDNYVGLGASPSQEPQGEAMTFDANDTGYYTTSENSAGATLPIYYYSRK